MTVLQAIKLNIYTLRTLRSDESAGYITLGRTSDISARDTDGDDLRSAGIWMDGDDDFSMSNPMDDIAPSECMLHNFSAAFAGTVAEHVNVTL